MEITELRLGNVRNLVQSEIGLVVGLNEFVGANGAGKTSVLEAVFMLSHGRSFRAVRRESLIRFGCESLEVFALVQRNGSLRRLGLSRRKGDWSARVDGAEVVSLAQLLSEIAVVCFEPGSHELISGAADERRHFVDWALFHVERDYVEIARRFRRALKQRNALLRSGVSTEGLDAWDAELVRSGTVLDEWRQKYLAALLPGVEELAKRLLPELGVPTLKYQRGWPVELTFEEALSQRRERDLERAHTGSGPHRADWRLSFPAAPEREHLSRGQEKLTALVCLLGQAELFHKQCGDWPVLCLDDLASELDLDHQQRVFEWLSAIDAQVLLTGTAPLAVTPSPLRQHARFHVEQGRVERLL
jgi:DNA replication and repair protein RecF